MRSFLATIIGAAASIGGIQLFEFLGHKIYPLGKLEGFHPKAPEDFLEIYMYYPVAALLLVITAHGLGLMIGLVVSRIIERSTLLPLFVVSGLLMLSAILNVLMMPHPFWFIVADLGLILILSFLFIATRKKA